MRPGNRRPAPPTHIVRGHRLPAYDRTHERQAGRNVTVDLIEGHSAIAAASTSLAAYMYREELRGQGVPEANPLNDSDVA